MFNDAKYSSLSFNFDKDLGAVESKVGGSLNANNPDLKAFKAHGGKMLHYHGWYDGSPSPLASVEYYRSVMAAMGGAKGAQEFYRLYMAPGMMHCGTGTGAEQLWQSDGHFRRDGPGAQHLQRAARLG